MKKMMLKASFVFSIFAIMFMCVANPMDSNATAYSKTKSTTLTSTVGTVTPKIKCTFDDTKSTRWSTSVTSFTSTGGATNIIVKKGAPTESRTGNVYTYKQAYSATMTVQYNTFTTDSKSLTWRFDDAAKAFI